MYLHVYYYIMISDNINNMYYNNYELAWKNHTCCTKTFEQAVVYKQLLHGHFVHYHTNHGIREDQSLNIWILKLVNILYKMAA